MGLFDKNKKESKNTNTNADVEKADLGMIEEIEETPQQVIDYSQPGSGILEFDSSK